jgi:hypothetical protein
MLLLHSILSPRNYLEKQRYTVFGKAKIFIPFPPEVEFRMRI